MNKITNILTAPSSLPSQQASQLQLWQSQAPLNKNLNITKMLKTKSKFSCRFLDIIKGRPKPETQNAFKKINKTKIVQAHKTSKSIK